MIMRVKRLAPHASTRLPNPRPNVVIHRSPDGNVGLAPDGEAAIREIQTILDTPPLQLFKEDRRSSVVLCEALGRRWVVKTYRDHLFKMWVYGWVRRSVAWREWRSARLLRAAGLRVVEPAALIRGPGGVERLILPHIPGQTFDRLVTGKRSPCDWSDEVRALRVQLAYRIGCQVGQLAKAGYYNRDYKPTNLLLDERHPPGDEPWLIDASLRRLRSDRQVCVCLAIMTRSVNRVGRSTRDEYHAALRGLTKTYPVIFERRDKRWIIQRIAAMLRSFYRKYGPDA